MDTSKTRTRTRVATYLIGTRGDTILLAFRQNVGHMNNMWSLVAGHVYERESPIVGMVREFEEECGLKLKVGDLKISGVMYSKAKDFDYINFIYTADLSGKELENKEPHKCGALEFHPLNELPDPMDPYIKKIIKKSYEGGLWICENGWKSSQII